MIIGMSGVGIWDFNLIKRRKERANEAERGFNTSHSPQLFYKYPTSLMKQQVPAELTQVHIKTDWNRAEVEAICTKTSSGNFGDSGRDRAGTCRKAGKHPNGDGK
ncbi:hypothetical protein C5167_007266 [Papaver somniferum]|nr:hypothetical protein C5167_007266 [Papaver somniferum]